MEGEKGTAWETYPDKKNKAVLGQLVQLATKYDDEVAAAAAAAAAAMGPQLPDVMYLEATGNIPLVIGIPLGGFKRPSCADDDLPVRTPIKLSTDSPNPLPIKLSADRHAPPPPLLLLRGQAVRAGKEIVDAGTIAMAEQVRKHAFCAI